MEPSADVSLYLDENQKASKDKESNTPFREEFEHIQKRIRQDIEDLQDIRYAVDDSHNVDGFMEMVRLAGEKKTIADSEETLKKIQVVGDTLQASQKRAVDIEKEENVLTGERWRLKHYIDSGEYRLPQLGKLQQVFLRKELEGKKKDLLNVEGKLAGVRSREQEERQLTIELSQAFSKLQDEFRKKIVDEVVRRGLERRKEFENLFISFTKNDSLTTVLYERYYADIIKPQLVEGSKNKENPKEWIEKAEAFFAEEIKEHSTLTQNREVFTEKRAKAEEIGGHYAQNAFENMFNQSAELSVSAFLRHIAGNELAQYAPLLRRDRYTSTQNQAREITDSKQSFSSNNNPFAFEQLTFNQISLEQLSAFQIPWFIGMLSSPEIMQTFGNELATLHRQIYNHTLENSMLDTEGYVIDRLRFYPTPDSLKELCLLAAAAPKAYRNVHANWTLSAMARESYWPTLLQKSVKAHPSLQSFLPTIEHWDFNEHYQNPQILGKAKGLVLEMIRDPHTPKHTLHVALDAVLAGEYTDEDAGEIVKKANELQYQSKEINILQLLTNPEYKAIYARLREEADQPLWDTVIPDRQAFWAANVDVVAALLRAGFDIPNFRRFRSAVNNQGVTSYLRGEEKYIEMYRDLREEIGITLDNIYYTSGHSLSLIANEVKNPRAAKFYRRLLAQQPRSFTSAILTLHDEKRQFPIDITKSEIEDLIFIALNQFGNITPMIIEQCVLQKDLAQRAEFLESFIEIQRRLFLNEAIKSYAKEHNMSMDVLAEYIALTFPGNNSYEVLSLLEHVEDRCEDLSGLVIRKEGYKGISESKRKIIQLRQGQTPDPKVTGTVVNIFNEEHEEENIEESKKKVIQGFQRLIQEPLTAEAWWNTRGQEAVGVIRAALGDKIEIFSRGVSFDITQTTNIFDLYRRSVELFGIYYKDNAQESIKKFLENNPDVTQAVTRLLSVKRLDQLVKDFSKVSPDQKTKLTFLVDTLKQSMNEGSTNNDAIAGLMAFLVENRLFTGSKGLRKQVEKELQKFEQKTEEGQLFSDQDVFTAHVSKNAASFFAKQTAGVCTAKDTELFNRPDHFHVNLVKNNEVVGNIQGYIIEDYPSPTDPNKHRALLFRGFNPSTSFISATNVERVCDQMIDVVKQIARDNGITDVFIPEQTNWHALTNRVGEGVINYFVSKHLKPENELQYQFEITDRVFVQKVYRIV